MEIVDAGVVPPDRLRGFLVWAWHADYIVAHGERIRPADSPGFVALDADRIVGHVSYRIIDQACELTSIVAEPRGRGIGSILLEAVVDAARVAGCLRVWLTTTNDNIDALRFYQRRGLRLMALRPGAVDEWRRRLKPEIPAIGAYGIPMRDELDLELEIVR
ncbi:MAG TPA: GNAT family N-acetyltransferase [Candidatus Limnocylindria bacterium]|nr:GNAT family N-acetyltransferase [Candidatus Limnocylindria bacterium]